MNRNLARTTWKHFALTAALLIVGAQFIPVARDNPPGSPAALAYTSAPLTVQASFERSCNSCHSNQTVWPWYSRIAPISWIVVHDVHEGRRKLNFSEWESYSDKKKQHKLEAICEQLANDDMPDNKYLLIHRNARLTPQQREAVCNWAETMR